MCLIPFQDIKDYFCSFEITRRMTSFLLGSFVSQLPNEVMVMIRDELHRLVLVHGRNKNNVMVHFMEFEGLTIL